MQRIGIVVIGRNEGARLAACLRALVPTGAPIVYADSNSTDGSEQLAASLGARVVRLDPGRPMNAARGRKEGTEILLAEHPATEYIFYIDGDCILQPGFLDQASDFLDRHPHAAVACGRRFEAHPEASFYNRLCDEEWNTPVGKVAACGGDSLMRADAVIGVGGFDDRLMASEEPELSARLRAAGWEIWRIDARMTEHDAAIMSFPAYFRRHLRGGVGYFQAWRRTADLPAPINGRTLASALAWVVGVPLLVVLIALALGSPWILLLLPLIYLVQVTRLALRRGPGLLHNWKASAALMSIKPAELIGAATALLARGPRDAIQYKRA